MGIEKCYAKELGGCIEPMTGEHYISETALHALLTPRPGKKPVIRVGGTTWLAEGEQKDVGLASLRAKVLCKRHNELLSDVDEVGGYFVTALRAALSEEVVDREVDGHLLERWFLKCICSSVAGGAFRNKQGQIVPPNLPAGWIGMLYGQRPMPVFGGLYVRGPLGAQIRFTEAPGIAFGLMSSGSSINHGCQLSIFGLPFFFTAALNGTTDELDAGSHYRPSSLTFTARSGSTSRIRLRWNDATYRSVEAIGFQLS